MVLGLGGGIAGGAVVSITILGIDKFSKVLSSATSKFGTIGRVVGGVAKTITALTAATLGTAAAIGVNAVKSAADFEQQMAAVRKTTGATKEETVALGKKLRALSAGPLVASAEELANVAAVAGQLGIRGSDNILKFSESMIKASVALDLTAEDAATSTAKIANAFGLPISEAENFLSSINELSNTSAAAAPQIISALTRVASAAAPLGFSVQDIAALTSQLIAMGEAPERAGTQLRTAFTSMAKKVKESSALLGLNEKQFKEAFGKDQIGTLKLMMQALNDIEDPFTRLETAADIFGSVGANAINKISSNLEGLETSLNISNVGFEEGTSLQEEYAAAVDTSKAGFQNLKEKIEDVSKTIGTRLLPMMDPLVKKISEFIDKMVESGVIDTILDGIFTAFDAVKEVAMEFVNNIDWELVKENVVAIWDKIVENKGTIIEVFKTMAKKGAELFNSMSSLVKTLIENGMIEQMIKGFERLATAINLVLDAINFVVRAFQKLIEFIDEHPRLSGFLEAINPAMRVGKGLDFIKEARAVEEISTSSSLAAGNPELNALLGGAPTDFAPWGVTINVETLNSQSPEEAVQIMKDELDTMDGGF